VNDKIAGNDRRFVETRAMKGGKEGVEKPAGRENGSHHAGKKWGQAVRSPRTGNLKIKQAETTTIEL